MLHQLHQLLSASSQVSSQDLQDFTRLLWAAHLTCVANQSQQAGLLELAARQLTALLHYIGIVPVDRWAAATQVGVLRGLNCLSQHAHARYCADVQPHLARRVPHVL
jgi:hypothetical protein